MADLIGADRHAMSTTQPGTAVPRTARFPGLAQEADVVKMAKPAIGEIVQDTRRNRTGCVMGHEGPYVQLRPVAGGREWDASPKDLRPATGAEAQRARTETAAVGGERR